MGIHLFSHSTYDQPIRDMPIANPNPDPSNYEIIETFQEDNILVVKIRYPNCTTYEGLKILVYFDVTLEQLKQQKLIDPHFSENKNFASPIARFEPTERGWFMAKGFARVLASEQGEEE